MKRTPVLCLTKPSVVFSSYFDLVRFKVTALKSMSLGQVVVWVLKRKAPTQTKAWHDCTLYIVQTTAGRLALPEEEQLGLCLSDSLYH